MICVLLALLGGAVQAHAAGAAVVLNEVNCEGTDWVELVNTAEAEADVSGWLLTDRALDDAAADHRLILPAPTTIPAGGNLVIERGAGGFPFGISCGDDTIILADETESEVDREVIPELTSDADTWGRYPNGVGEWVQTAATRGEPNEPSSATGEPGGDQAAWLFDPGAVVAIDLELPPASREGLALDPGEHQDGTFSLTTADGTYGPLDVGIRLKGGLGSFRTLDGKAAFKVKFGHSVPGQRFLGLKTLTLNNMAQDPSQIHETLAYETFRAVGVAAPRTGYAYVWVDGEDYGLYLNVETLDDISLPRWFDSTQHLYEGEYGADLLPGHLDRFEVDEGSESDRGDLEAMIEAASGPGGGWRHRVAKVADLEQMTRVWAVERYIGHWDSYSGDFQDSLHPNNFYLHSDEGDTFTMLPWGTDQTWAYRMPFEGPGGHLFERCLRDIICAGMYRDSLVAVRSAIASLDLDGRASGTASVLDVWQQLDPRREHSLEQIEAGVAGVRSFISARPADLEDPSYWDPVVDRAAPETAVTAGPRRMVRTRRARVRVRLRFRSFEEGSRFECRVDKRRWASCESPFRPLVGRGRHVFLARAIDAAGNADVTPARHTWRVKQVRFARAAGPPPPRVSR